MRKRVSAPVSIGALLLLAAFHGCGETAPPERPNSPGAGDAGTTGPGVTEGGSSGGAPVLPARIRRLTNAEYDASIRALLRIDSNFGSSFTPDARQDGFTRNDAQRVDPVLTMQINDAAEQIAAQARATLNQLAPCANPTVGGEACARTFLGAFAVRAYRRPATSREIDALLGVYRAAASGASYADGLEAVIHAVLVSPGFLYTTELGASPGQPVATLTPHETATAIAYLLTGAPPDDALLAAADSGAIMASDARQSHGRRLFTLPAAAGQVARIIEEWLGIDRIVDTAKDSKAYPDYAGLKDAMKREADAFITEVMWRTTGDLGELLSANWTIADDNLAAMYGGSSMGGRVSLANVRRRGILNQGAFLSVYAHAHETSPVLRGVALLRRVTCISMPSPTSLNINVVPPVPDPSKTTRQRFAVHSTDAVCASCHNKIDGFGFAFEHFDGMGKQRSTDNGRPVDSSADVVTGLDIDGAYADSAALVIKLSTSPAVRTCFARHVFRAAAARSDRASENAEAAFVSVWNGLPAAKQGNIGEVLLAWLGSESFVQRRAEP